MLWSLIAVFLSLSRSLALSLSRSLVFSFCLAHSCPLPRPSFRWETAKEGKSAPGVRRWILGGLSWTFGNQTEPHYAVGDLIGIKSKHGGQSFFIDGGNDVGFYGVKWTEHSRGVVRGGVNNIVVQDCTVQRSPLAPEGLSAAVPGPCLATPGGGPQLGQPADETVIFNVKVENYRSTGMDSSSLLLDLLVTLLFITAQLVWILLLFF